MNREIFINSIILKKKYYAYDLLQPERHNLNFIRKIELLLIDSIIHNWNLLNEHQDNPALRYLFNGDLDFTINDYIVYMKKHD